MPASEQSMSQAPHRIAPAALPGVGRLTLLYILALSVVALLSLTGQAFVHFYFEGQRSDSKVINIAGRQRMLSQRIAKEALAARTADRVAERTARNEALCETLTLWERCHRGLKQGDAELGLPGRNSDDVLRMFAELQPKFVAVLAPAKRLCKADTDASHDATATDDIAELLRCEPSFLDGMDSIVSQYEREASQRVAQVQQVERGLLLITLVVLLLEGYFVFRPAVRRIRAAVSALQATTCKLAVAKEAAEKANRAKSQFLANTSHELRTPLHAILGIAEQFQKVPLDSEQRQAIGVLRGAAATLMDLVNDLLDLTRIESGALELRMEPTPIDALVEQSLSFIRSEAEKKGLILTASLANNLPGCVVTDPLRLRQVLLNLLGNAIKFTDRGTVLLSLECLDRDANRATIRFTVADSGIGIPQAEQSSVFESFSQVDASLSRTRGGIGLGLAISRRLVELLGGTLALASEPGHGSRFYFTLSFETTRAPVIEAASVGSCEEHSVATTTADATGENNRRTVLIVDDAQANRYLASNLLRKAGYSAAAASSGVEALAMVAETAYDAILLDIHMPEMNGFEVAQAIRRSDSEHSRRPTAILVLTADLLLETRVRLQQCGVDAILHKPANGGEILTALATLLGSSIETPQGEVSRTGGTLARLQKDGALLADLIDLFENESKSLCGRIESGLRESNCWEVRHAAHRLRGQGLIFEANELCATLAAIEERAAAGDLLPCSRLWEKAQIQVRSLGEELRR